MDQSTLITNPPANLKLHLHGQLLTRYHDKPSQNKISCRGEPRNSEIPRKCKRRPSVIELSNTRENTKALSDWVELSSNVSTFRFLRQLGTIDKESQGRQRCNGPVAGADLD
jgi:hypothetical protein